MGAFKKIMGRKVYIDLTGIPDTEQDGYTWNMLNNCRKAHMREKALKAIFPYQHILGKRRIIEDPGQLQTMVDQYFDSCQGPLIDKYGQMVRDDDGKIIFVQTRPYTLSGLASALGMSTCTLRAYNWKSLAGLVHPEFSDVILRARQKIQEYSEEQLYNVNGARGAQFMLQAGFAWSTSKEQSEIARNNATIKQMQQEFELKKKDYELKLRQLKLKEKMIELGESEDSQITINIVRANKKQGDEE